MIDLIVGEDADQVAASFHLIERWRALVVTMTRYALPSPLRIDRLAALESQCRYRAVDLQVKHLRPFHGTASGPSRATARARDTRWRPQGAN